MQQPWWARCSTWPLHRATCPPRRLARARPPWPNDRNKLRHVANREAWCITLVKRRCVDLLRRRRPTVDIETLYNMADEPAADDERLRLAIQFINRLPERQARAVRLRHFAAADTQAIARTLQINEGNVYTLLSRAYSTLKQMILDYEKE